MLYHTKQGSFDIYKREDEKFDVNLMPKTQTGVGNYLATFDSQSEAEEFCESWAPDEQNS